MASGELANKYSKLEVLKLQKRIDGLNLVYGGIKNMVGLPGASFIVDMVGDAIAVAESRKLGLPIIGIVDTNVDPRLATHPIPGNDDAIQSLQIITDFIQAAVSQGLSRRAVEPKPDPGPGSRQPETDSDAPAVPARPVTGVIG